MMNHRAKAALALTIAGIIALMIGCIQARRHSLSVRRSPPATAASQKQEQLAFPQNSSAAVAIGGSTTPQERIQLKEFAPMEKMVGLMRSQVEEISSSNLIRDMSLMGFEPNPTFNNSSATGRITTISTMANPDPNMTRYLWAEFRSDADKSGEYLQMMNFELRKGPTALEEAQEMVKKVFAITRAPDFKSENGVAWDINEAYEVLVVKITQAHVQEGVMDRRYTTDDIGVIQITLQARVDDDHDD